MCLAFCNFAGAKINVILNKSILKLAIPFVISNISIPLLGIADLALLGHLNTDNPGNYIGAIALGGMIFNIIYWGFGFLRMGTSGFTAQAFGRNDKKESMLILSRAVLVALAGGFVLIALQFPIARLSFWIMEGSPDIENLASEYFMIRIWAAPATISIYALSGWFLGMQNAKYPMWVSILVNVFNLGFNVLFVYVFDMKHQGVALGTVIAQYCGLGLAVFLFSKKFRGFLSFWDYKSMIDWQAMKQFFLVNKDIFIRTMLLIFTFSFFTNESARMGDEILAVNTILLQFLFIFSYFIDGFANAAEALVGKFIGKNSKPLLIKSVKYLFLWGTFLSLPFSLLYFVLGDNLLYLLTDNPGILAASTPYLFWVVLIPVVSFAAFIWDGIFIGATETAPMRNTLIVATLLVFLPAYYLFSKAMGNHGLWLAMLLFMFMRGLLLSFYAPKHIFRKL
jgi:MATE family, multidrug efflux pump